ncbi:hypothetical protein NECAME_09543 [Necator americanus]|uniref:Uncharacterized protein n=1 Tax=Necator americanus TaxID=51031 RepID=W2TDJ1_NECAM|nr:hypothetical protein NECAME_09543 [Necator americanus]ETN79888.1 hypothetical protein NECAME_09543 [Necator americanus]
MKRTGNREKKQQSNSLRDGRATSTVATRGECGGEGVLDWPQPPRRPLAALLQSSCPASETLRKEMTGVDSTDGDSAGNEVQPESGCTVHCNEAVEQRLMSRIDTQSECASETEIKKDDTSRYRGENRNGMVLVGFELKYLALLLTVLIVGCIGLLINVIGIGMFHGGHGHTHGDGGHGHAHGDGGHGHSHGEKSPKKGLHEDSDENPKLKTKDDPEECEIDSDSDAAIVNRPGRSRSRIGQDCSHNHLALKLVNLDENAEIEEFTDSEAAKRKQKQAGQGPICAFT